MKPARKLKADSFVIDGEFVNGISDFACLHSQCFDHEAFLYGFDLLELNGESLRDAPLLERKLKLEKLLRKASARHRYCEHDNGDGEQLFRAACRMGLEGIVSKRLESRDRSGRCRSWVKVKNKQAPGYLRVRDGLEG